MKPDENWLTARSATSIKNPAFIVENLIPIRNHKTRSTISTLLIFSVKVLDLKKEHIIEGVPGVFMEIMKLIWDCSDEIWLKKLFSLLSITMILANQSVCSRKTADSIFLQLCNSAPRLNKRKKVFLWPRMKRVSSFTLTGGLMLCDRRELLDGTLMIKLEIKKLDENGALIHKPFITQLSTR